MKHLYTVEWTYANGKKERVKLKARNLDEAIKYVTSINSQTTMTARILKERKVMWEYQAMKTIIIAFLLLAPRPIYIVEGTVQPIERTQKYDYHYRLDSMGTHSSRPILIIKH